MLFTSKANTLMYFQSVLKKSIVLPIFCFTVREYIEQPDIILNKINTLYDGIIIVRSSALTEDTDITNAGHFCSVLNVDSRLVSDVKNAINHVIDSYKKDQLNDRQQILIQSQLSDVKISGVVITHDPKSGAPYFIMSYDDTGSTNSVTSGICKHIKLIARDYENHSLWSKICSSIREVESNTNDNFLDIEFAIDSNDQVYLFQVRRMHHESSICQDGIVLERKEFFKQIITDNNDYLSDMAFWNPSEMIGSNPHLLDYSIYSELITDSAWNAGIVAIGYPKINEKLMYKLGNKPYISLRKAFASLTPVQVPKEIACKLQAHYFEKIRREPYLHDKIEFEIVYSCFDFVTKNRTYNELQETLTSKELTILNNALLTFNTECIGEFDEWLKRDEYSICELEKIRETISVSLCSNTSVNDLLRNIEEIINAIKKYGTPQFARQARYAFISRDICLSLVEMKLVSRHTIDKLYSSISTITTKFSTDLKKTAVGEIGIEDLVAQYGHLRTGTYSINTPTYSVHDFEQMVKYQTNLAEKGCELKKNDADLSELDEIFCPGTSIKLVDFVKKTTIAREKFKFIYSKSLSLLLDILIKLANKLDFSNTDFSNLALEDIINVSRYELNEIRRILGKKIELNKSNYNTDSFIRLPSVIFQPDDLDIFDLFEDRPNYVTDLCIHAETVFIDETYKCHDIDNKIVIVERADPGYDWIFTSKKIKGLITKYGGMASHLAIRCLEFDIPAAIGCGEYLFDKVRSKKEVTLDCGNEKIE